MRVKYFNRVVAMQTIEMLYAKRKGGLVHVKRVMKYTRTNTGPAHCIADPFDAAK